MDWINPNDQLPPQGKKIIGFYAGDIYVVQRFGPYWVPIPFRDSQFRFSEAPELWADIEPPGNYTGKLHVFVTGEKYDIDAFEKYFPVKYQELIEGIRESFHD
jgi:hypothetical protein